jgi:hypothetical protein
MARNRSLVERSKIAYFLASDGEYRNLKKPRIGCRFGRTHAKRYRARTALSRVKGYLKDAIEAIANSKIRRMQRELVLRSTARALATFLGPSWDGPVRKYHPEKHYMRGPGPKWHEKHFLHRASAGGS